ncbi:MAG: GNAT family N-acetyltransferase [Candidatus Fimenecus sp.]
MPVHLRKMQDCTRDYRLLLQWYSAPQVQEYFSPPVTTLEETVEKYRPRIMGESSVIPYIIETDDVPVGYLQIFPLTDKETARYGAENYQTPYGADLFIGNTSYLHKGIGTAALTVCKDLIKTEFHADVLCLDPRADNHAALRCYQNCDGKIVRAYFDNDYQTKICILHIAL